MASGLLIEEGEKMRTEEEMFQMILEIAKQDERIRAVYLNGSRTNPNVKKDEYQDFDIVYVVNEVIPFLNNPEWLKKFGEIAVMQEPNSKAFGWEGDHNEQESYTWLMLLSDGYRIDLHLDIKKVALDRYLEDTLTIKLLDKDDFLPDLAKANDQFHWIQKPSQIEFHGVCNEFWWCLNNVAKGLNRHQIPYVLKMYYEIVHPQLFQLVDWSVAQKNNFQITTGLFGKNYEMLLTKERYEAYLKTYPNPNPEAIWQAIFNACDLFRELGIEIAESLGFSYNLVEDQNMQRYLTQMYKKENDK